MSEFYYDFNKGKKIQDIAERHIKYYLDDAILKTDSKSSQPIDFVSKNGDKYEIKSGYNEYLQTIIIEEYSKGLSEYNKDGWWYKLENNTIILFFPSYKYINTSREFIYLKITEEIKNIYNDYSINYKLYKNKPTETIYGNSWISAYKKFPLSFFCNKFIKYKIIKDFL